MLFIFYFQELKKLRIDTVINDTESQLKRTYIERCKRLPAFGCNIYFVKEVQRGRTKTKVILSQCYNHLYYLYTILIFDQLKVLVIIVTNYVFNSTSINYSKRQSDSIFFISLR